jgi:hypothetical protein
MTQLALKVAHFGIWRQLCLQLDEAPGVVVNLRE